MTTIKDVAEYAGVAVSTVSNVLNNPGIVSAKTQKKVLKAVDELKYIPNIYGQNLKQQKQNRIGIFMHHFGGDFYFDFLQTASMTATQQGYSVNVFLPTLKERANMINAVLNGMYDGAIVTDAEFTYSDIDTLVSRDFPVVFIDREISAHNISSVLIDNLGGSYQMTKYLIMMGHKSIAFVHGRDNYDNKLRYEGYVNALYEYKLLPALDGHFMCNFTKADAYHDIREFCYKGGEMPDAFFAANDEMAHGIIAGLTSMGYRVPEDISVVGFDDIVLSEVFTPPLTTVQSPREAVGRVAVETLIGMINKDREGQKILLDTKLMIRNSADLRGMK